MRGVRCKTSNMLVVAMFLHHRRGCLVEMVESTHWSCIWDFQFRNAVIGFHYS